MVLPLGKVQMTLVQQVGVCRQKRNCVHLVAGIWTIQNGVYGRLFGAINQIFLPAAGGRDVNGALVAVGTGRYWSNTPRGPLSAIQLSFNRTRTDVGGVFIYSRANSHSIRCVAE